MFNLSLLGTFTWPTPPGPYRATTCRKRELNYGSHTYFFDHTRTWMASPDEWSAQCRGHLRDSTNMKDNKHQAHTLSHPNKANMEWWLRRGPKVSWHLSYRWRKNLTQETCPDRGSNPGPLRDKRATTCSTTVDKEFYTSIKSLQLIRKFQNSVELTRSDR